jgi:hypothetical protein
MAVQAANPPTFVSPFTANLQFTAGGTATAAATQKEAPRRGQRRPRQEDPSDETRRPSLTVVRESKRTSQSL